MLNTQINISTDNFDGPLSLLLMLVQREEMDIRNLDISAITTEYLDYLAGMKDLNFDIAGDYLYFAATLLLIKSKNCLFEPQEEESEKPDNILSEEELIARLERLSLFKKLGELIWAIPKRDHEIFTRPKTIHKQIQQDVLLPGDKDQLIQAYIGHLRKGRRQFAVVKKEKIPLREKLKELRDILHRNQSTNFKHILQEGQKKDNSHIVSTFIALLELARIGKIDLFQTNPYGTIHVNLLESFQELDMDRLLDNHHFN